MNLQDLTLPDLLFRNLPPWAMLVDLVAHIGVGFGFGIVYFRGLWWTLRLFNDGRALAGIAWMVGRFVLVGAVLVLATLEGAAPLLALAAGILAARWMAVRNVRKASP